VIGNQATSGNEELSISILSASISMKLITSPYLNFLFVAELKFKLFVYMSAHIESAATNPSLI